jgi:hypothetical protein
VSRDVLADLRRRNETALWALIRHPATDTCGVTMPEPAQSTGLAISPASIAEIKYVSDVQAGREPDPCPACGSTDHPVSRHPAVDDSLASQRSGALAVLAHISSFLPADVRAILGVSAYLLISVQLDTENPDDGSDLAVLCGLKREPEVSRPEGSEYVHHYWEGHFGRFELSIAVLTSPTDEASTNPDQKEITDGRA